MKHHNGIQRVVAAFLSIFFSFFLTACDRAGNDDTATLRIHHPGNEVASQKATLYKLSGVPSNITRILINVSANSGVITSADLLTNEHLKFIVPAGVPLTVEGLAYSGTQLLYQGSSAVPALRSGDTATVSLTLNALNGGPPIIITARTRIDTSQQGEPANSDSNGVVFSADHRFVLFRSNASNLVPDDTNAIEDLFQKDLTANTIALVSSTSLGQGIGFTGSGDRPYRMSADGRYIVFAQRSRVVDPKAVNDTFNLYRKDTQTNTLTELLQGPDAQSFTNFPDALSISADAQRVAYEYASDGPETIIYDAQTGKQASFYGGEQPSLSADGTSLVYWVNDNSELPSYQLYLSDVELMLAGNPQPILLGFLARPLDATPQVAPASLSADGTQVAFNGHSINDPNGSDRPLTYYTAGSEGFMVLSSNANNVELSGNFVYNETPTLSANSNYASFTFGSTSTVYVKNTTNGQLAAVANAADNAVISSDAQLVAYRSAGHVYVDINPFLNTQAVAIAPDLKAVTLNNQTTLSWDPVPGATSFDIYAANDPSVSASNYLQLGGVKFTGVSSPFTLPANSLPGNGTYYFIVVPVNAAGSGAASQGAPVDITTNTGTAFSISGSSSGLLTGAQVVLTLSGANITTETATLSSSVVRYFMETSLPEGKQFTLTLDTATNGQICIFANSTNTVTHTMGAANITDADVTCLTPISPVLNRISASDGHTCIITERGGVKCWGANGQGELGDGSTTFSRIPVTVANLYGVTSLAVGYRFSCALTVETTVKCWGWNNTYGQLGNGAATDSYVPVTVKNLSDVVALAAGDYHTCALLNTGAVWCWGNNGSGELGIGVGYGYSNVPVQVSGVTGAISISEGRSHSCVLLNTGKVKCWGNNYYGQLGNGGPLKGAGSTTPVDVVNVSGATSISMSGMQSCAVLTSGEVQCWGEGTSTPLVVTSLPATSTLRMGGSFSCALNTTGTVQCWGTNNYGQLGNGTNTDSNVPVSVSNLSGAVAMAVGTNHACAMLDIGGVRCWGSNDHGKLGDGFAGPGYHSNIPVTVLNLTNGPTIAAGIYHTCAMSPTNKLQCWGLGIDGQLGSGAMAQQSFPWAVRDITVTSNGDITRDLSGVTTVAAGHAHTCALLNDGTVECWGSNASGQLGLGQQTGSANYPTSVPNLSGVKALVAGKFHTCALTTQGQVYCWGENSNGQVGDGTQVNAYLPVLVPTLSDVKAIGVGDTHSCAVLNNGMVKCWGANRFGQLGDGSTTGSSTDLLSPVTVSNLTGAIVVHGGSRHTCALLDDATVRCWGYNINGRLGNGTTKDSGVPVVVSDLFGVASIAVGSGHSCALGYDGSMKCWGGNAASQLGDGSQSNSIIPVAVANLTGAADITAGEGHTCARLLSGETKCWGSNFYSQLGTGNSLDAVTPVSVINLLGTLRVATGAYDTCLLNKTSDLKCFGNNTYGAFGNGTTTKKQYAMTIVAQSDYTQLAAGEDSTCGLTSAGQVRCWGLNRYGQLGNGTTTNSLVPVNVNGLENVIAISAFMYHVCALTAGQTVLCWGINEQGQLGNGTLVNSSIPVLVNNLNNVVQISVGNQASCARLATGKVNCWGNNLQGHFGDGTNTSSSTPVPAFGNLTAASIAVGQWNVCVISDIGSVLCSGTNTNGELGNGGTADSNIPVAVTGITGATALTAGLHHECAVVASGTVQCWGYGDLGQLGNGAKATSRVPVNVSNWVSRVSAIDSGNEYTCAWTETGAAYCWGNAAFYLLGNSNYTGYPVSVSMD